MMTLPAPQHFTSRLALKEKISKNVYLEMFELIEPKEIAFISGQTIMVYVSPGINRSMSIASPPAEKHFITLVHDVAPMGPFSNWTLSVKVGDTMNFMGPLGSFVLDAASRRNKVFVATGVGISPFYGMALEYLTHGGTDAITIYWGLRHEEDIFWQKELEDLLRAHPNFHLVLTLSQPSDGWQGKRGHVQDHLFSQPNLSDTEYYICGNKAMVMDVREKLKTANIPDSQVKFELF